MIQLLKNQLNKNIVGLILWELNQIKKPEISVPCNYEQGHETFSFRFYVTNINNQIQIYFDSFLYVTLSSGKITVNSNQLT